MEIFHLFIICDIVDPYNCRERAFAGAARLNVRLKLSRASNRSKRQPTFELSNFEPFYVRIVCVCDERLDKGDALR